MKQIPVETAGLSGILLFKVFPGPPNYDCVEDGDYPEGCWLLKLDDRSKDILVATMDFDDSAWGGEVIIETKNDLSLYVNRKVSCQGTFRYAETGHHHTPLLLRLCRTILEDVP